MKTTGSLILTLILLAANSAFAESKTIVSCNLTGPDTLVGGIGIYQDEHELPGVWRGSISDNYMQARLVCEAEDRPRAIVCVGLWNMRGGEMVQIRLRKSAHARGYLVDLSGRPKFYGGANLTGVACQ